jgi:hypothetical protein
VVRPESRLSCFVNSRFSAADHMLIPSVSNFLEDEPLLEIANSRP